MITLIDSVARILLLAAIAIFLYPYVMILASNELFKSGIEISMVTVMAYGCMVYIGDILFRVSIMLIIGKTGIKDLLRK